MEPINQSTQLKNKLAPFRKLGVNVISSTLGIVLAGAAVAVSIRRPSKNNYTISVICANERMPGYEKDGFQSLGAVIAACERAIAFDEKINALHKG